MENEKTNEDGEKFLSKNQQRLALLRAFQRVEKERQFVKDCMMIPPSLVISEEVRLLTEQVSAN